MTRSVRALEAEKRLGQGRGRREVHLEVGEGTVGGRKLAYGSAGAVHLFDQTK